MTDPQTTMVRPRKKVSPPQKRETEKHFEAITFNFNSRGAPPRKGRKAISCNVQFGTWSRETMTKAQVTQLKVGGGGGDSPHFSNTLSPFLGVYSTLFLSVRFPLGVNGLDSTFFFLRAILWGYSAQHLESDNYGYGRGTVFFCLLLFVSGDKVQFC